MADVSAIFHWPPSAFDGLTLEAVMDWRELAIERGKMLGLFNRE